MHGLRNKGGNRTNSSHYLHVSPGLGVELERLTLFGMQHELYSFSFLGVERSLRYQTIYLPIEPLEQDLTLHY